MSVRPLINLSPPQAVRGMKVLDRSLFTMEFPLLGMKIKNRDIHTLLDSLSGYKLAVPRLRTIAPIENNTSEKLLLLDPSIQFQDYPWQVRSYIYNLYKEKLPKAIPMKEYTESLKDENMTEFTLKMNPHDEESRLAFNLAIYNQKLDYNFWSSDEIMNAIVPETTDRQQVVTSFEAVGHIAHMNLRDQILEYKHIVGQVILDKNPSIRTVVNKTDNIHAVFRYFEYEVIAGDVDMHATVFENDCTFSFDYSKVYWNSRLGHEHLRMVNLFPKNSVVCDMMCGVGPFALPAALKQNCLVYANDLNENSYKALLANVASNKIPASKIKAFNLDSRDFVRELIQLHAAQPTEYPLFKNVVMNLPASAVTFLPVFKGIFTPLLKLYEKNDIVLPRIHCYTFTKGKLTDEEHLEEGIRQLIEHLDYPFTKETAVPTIVRNVAPNKLMLCLSFNLPLEIAFYGANGQAEEANVHQNSETHSKRQKIDNSNLKD